MINKGVTIGISSIDSAGDFVINNVKENIAFAEISVTVVKRID
ncbi:hypothetical protein [Vibrio gazogenes]|nr:hypothetical protein [Vibrio gazogenes]